MQWKLELKVVTVVVAPHRAIVKFVRQCCDVRSHWLVAVVAAADSDADSADVTVVRTAK